MFYFVNVDRLSRRTKRLNYFYFDKVTTEQLRDLFNFVRVTVFVRHEYHE